MGKLETDIWFWVVKYLPKKMVYFCFLQVLAVATTGKYGNTVVDQISGLEAVKRWDDTYKVFSK